MLTFQPWDQIQEFKVTICDLEGFGAPRTAFKIGARKIAETYKSQKQKLS